MRTGQSVSITLEAVTNATTYEIRKDGVLLSAQSGLTFTDTIFHRLTFTITEQNLQMLME